MPSQFPDDSRDRLPISRAAFTLVELLVVIGIILVLTTLLIPAVNSLKNAGGVTEACYDVSGALEMARSHALANHTYVWVGFAEEDADSSVHGNPGFGRIVLSLVASKTGSSLSDASGTSHFLDASQLIQVQKLITIKNARLFSHPVPPPARAGSGVAFETRPSVVSSTARIVPATELSDTSQFQFRFPLQAAGNPASCLFTQVIRFSPRGEAVLNHPDNLQPLLEIGLEQTRGSQAETNADNPAAVQITGLAGNVAIYRR